MGSFSHNLLFKSPLSSSRFKDTHTFSQCAVRFLSPVRLAHFKKAYVYYSVCVCVCIRVSGYVLPILFSDCNACCIIHVKPCRERYSLLSYNTTATGLWLISSHTWFTKDTHTQTIAGALTQTFCHISTDTHMSHSHTDIQHTYM